MDHFNILEIGGIAKDKQVLTTEDFDDIAWTYFNTTGTSDATVPISKEIDDFKEYMTPFEWQQVISAPKKENAFYKYWTKKEAVIKADGRGLSIPLKSFEVKEEIANIENSAYVLKEVFLDSEYTCYIALKKQKNIATQPQFDEKVVLNQVHISSEMKVAMV